MELFALLEEFKTANIGLSLEQERETIARYVYSTNRLEGNALTLAQTRSIIDSGVVSGENIRTKDFLEQRGTYRALLRMLNAVVAAEPLTAELIKELDWLAIGPLFGDDSYYAYKEAGQEFGGYKACNNRIDIALPDGSRHTIPPLSSPESVSTNMAKLLRQVEMSDKTIIEKAAFLAREIWLHQPFIDGNKRTARLLINFLTMREGFPLFTYEGRGTFFNSMLVTSLTDGKVGPIEEFITEALRDRTEFLLTGHRKVEKPKGFTL